MSGRRLKTSAKPFAPCKREARASKPGVRKAFVKQPLASRVQTARQALPCIGCNDPALAPYAPAVYVTERLAELLAQLAEEFIQHLFPRRLHEPRAHRCDESTHLTLRLALELTSVTIG
jgi:hypothetical protein